MTNPATATLIALGQDLFARAGRRHAAREATYQLRSLDDHLLRDIGIERSEIEAVIRRR
jgi:uncharacterized protein YjiS (DUF1127 family)